MELWTHPLRDFFIDCIESAIVLTDQRIISSITTITSLWIHPLSSPPRPLTRNSSLA